MVSNSTRRSRELNLYRLFQFWANRPKYKNQPSISQNFKFFISLLMTLRHLQNGHNDFNMTLQNVDIDLFYTCCYYGHNAPGKTACWGEDGVKEGSLFPYLLSKNNFPTTYDDYLKFGSFLKILWVSCSIKNFARIKHIFTSNHFLNNGLLKKGFLPFQGNYIRTWK